MFNTQQNSKPLLGGLNGSNNRLLNNQRRAFIPHYAMGSNNTASSINNGISTTIASNDYNTTPA